MDELVFGIRRITTPLPTRPGHVHSYLLPGEDGWTLVDTGIGLPNAQEVWQRVARRGGGGADLRHALPSRPRRRGGGRRRADRCARAPGRARLRAVRARLGQHRSGRSGSPSGSALTACRRDHRGADRVRRRLPAVHPLPAATRARRRGRPPRRLGARRGARARRRPALPAQGRRARLGRPPARTDLADRRPLAGEPARPARRLHRVARADDRARARDRAPRPRRPDRRPGRARPRADRAPPRAARLHGGVARRRAAHRLRGLVRALRRRAEARVAALRRRRDALAPGAPRAGGAGRAARGRRRSLPILRASLDDDPSSTRAPESGA